MKFNKDYKDYGNKYKQNEESAVINKDAPQPDTTEQSAVINKDNVQTIKEESAVISKAAAEPVTTQNYIKWEYGKVFNCVKLNVRKAPSKTADIAAVIKLDDTVKYTYTNDKDWYKVDNEKGAIGYCMAEFIKSET
jgi:hypothetical protein